MCTKTVWPDMIPISIDTNTIADVASCERDACSRSRFRSLLSEIDPAWDKARVRTEHGYHIATLYHSQRGT